MARRQIPLVGQSYAFSNRSISQQRAVNMYAIPSRDATYPAALKRRPGMRLIATAPNNGSCRGLHRSRGGTLYGVFGDRLYEIDGTTFIDHGEIPGTDPVDMQGNSVNLFIANGEGVYILSSSALVLGDNTPRSRRLSYMDSRIIATQQDTQQFFTSEVIDDEFPALNFASAEGVPDNLVVQFVHNQVLYMFGARSIEQWTSNPDPDSNGFQRIYSAIDTNAGTEAPYSVTAVTGMILFLGWDGHVYAIGRGSVTTEPVAAAIRSYARTDDAVGYEIRWDQRAFYVLQFPSARRTWVYDLSINAWFEWTTDIGGTEWAMSGYAYTNNTHYCGSSRDGGLYVLDADHRFDGEDIMEIRRTTSHIEESQRNIVMQDLQLHVETAVGRLGDGQAAETPAIRLRISKDHGNRFVEVGRRKLGRGGEYIQNTRWSALGTGRSWTFDFYTIDPVDIMFYGLSAEVTVLNR